jgi:hypothetical protein
MNDPDNKLAMGAVSSRHWLAEGQRPQLQQPRAWHVLLALLWLFQALAYGAGTVTNFSSSANLQQAMAGGGTVTFASNGTIMLTSAISVRTNTVLDATGYTVTISTTNGSNAMPVRLFEVEPGVTFTIDNLTLANGRGTNGGAIYNRGTLVLSDCTFSSNGAFGSNGMAGPKGGDDPNVGKRGGSGGSGGAGWGGAIYNLGDLAANGCTFTANSATGGKGGNGGNGGNVPADGFQGGEGGTGGNGAAAFGGAIYNLGTISLTDCTFTGNSATGGSGGSGGTGGSGPQPSRNGNGGAGAPGSGAGLYNLGRATVVNCTFSDNTAAGGNSATGGTGSDGNGSDGANGGDSLGGAICNLGTNTTLNCTFSTNKVSGGNGGNGGPSDFVGGDGGKGGTGSGGALYNSGRVALTNVTFSGSGAYGGMGGTNGSAPFPGSNGSNGSARGGNIANSGGTFTLKNCIVAHSLSGANFYGSFTDGGYNISSDGSVALTGAGSRISTDPKLGPLNTNGGPTRTMALLTNSPAIDTADPNFCLPTDQRGMRRPLGAACDIGAYEFEASNLDVPVRITSIVPTNFGQMQLNFLAAPIGRYLVQATTNFTNWQTVSTNTASSDGVFQFLDVRASNFPMRFYRSSTP